MKKLILLALLLITFTATSYAARPEKYGFRAYSTATPVTCTVFGGKALLTKDRNGYPIQGHAPDTSYSRSYSLGTKGFANHSTAGQMSFTFTCVNTGTSTEIPVKVFMDGIETYFLTMDSYTFVVGQ